MPVEIRWLGHASFRITSDESVVYIDPWKLPDEPHDADVVFVSHSHFDHFSAEDVRKVSREETVLVAPADVIEQLGAVNAITPGEGWTVQNVTIEAVAAYNIDKRYHPRGNEWLGAVLTIAGRRIYYAGDTDLIPEMSDLQEVDVALLPVGGTYTLDASEAAEACKAIGCARAVPYHWGDVVGGSEDAHRFAEQAPCEVRVLRPGETMELEPSE